MPWGLKRYYGTGSLHFITWSCYRRKPLLGNPMRRDLVLTVLERMRIRYRFAVIGYVVMPEHVHLLISEPLIGDPSKIIQAVKLSVSRRLAISGEFSGRFWQSRFYDFNLWGQRKEVERLKYMHRNPVVRGLVAGCPILAFFARVGHDAAGRSRPSNFPSLVVVNYYHKCGILLPHA